MKIIIFYIALYSFFCHHFVILFTSISGICYYLFTLFVVLIFKAVKMILQCSGISRSLMNAVMGDKLVFSTDLCIIGWLKLPIFHMVVFEPHEAGVGICLTITVAA